MKKCSKCENTKIRKGTGIMYGAYGGDVLLFTVYIYTKCGYSEFYLRAH